MKTSKISPKKQEPGIDITALTVEKENFVDCLNKKIPVKLLNSEYVNYIHHLMPDLNKEDIALVIIAFYKTIRKYSLMGYKISVSPIFNSFHVSIDKARITIKNKTNKSLKRIANA